MSSACSNLRRIWQTTATRSPAGIPLRPTPAAIDELFKEPNPDVLAAKFKQLSSSFYFRHKINVYSYTINRLAKQKRFSAIEDILEAHKKYYDITREGFAIRLMSLYGDAGMFDHARKLFDEMPQLKCERTNLSFNTLLGAALHCDEFHKVVEIFREYPLEFGFDPNVVSYNTVIRALAELGSVDAAVSMVDEMEMKGLEPNLATFNSLVIGVYGTQGFLEGERVWHLMLERVPGLIPGIRSYNAKLQGMINEGMVFDAVHLFVELRIKGLDPNTATYNHLIKGFCDQGDLEEAKKWCTELLDSGWYADGDTFHTLIRLLCENGDSDMALGLGKRMLGRYFLVDQDLLQMVVDTLVKDLKVKEANSLVKLARSNCFHQYNLVMPSDK